MKRGATIHPYEGPNYDGCLSNWCLGDKGGLPRLSSTLQITAHTRCTGWMEVHMEHP